MTTVRYSRSTSYQAGVGTSIAVHTRGVTGWCLERHDLVVAKLMAGRPHDMEFCRALVQAGIVDAETLRTRLSETVMNGDELTSMERRIARLISRR